MEFRVSYTFPVCLACLTGEEMVARMQSNNAGEAAPVLDVGGVGGSRYPQTYPKQDFVTRLLWV